MVYYPRACLLLSDLLAASTVPRHVLQLGREFLQWLYGDYENPEKCQPAWLRNRTTAKMTGSAADGQHAGKSVR